MCHQYEVPVNTTGLTLSDLWRAVLDNPYDDGPRLAYAARLAERGYDGDAAMVETIRSQIAHPTRRIPVSEAEAGKPIAITATARRGFIAEVDVALTDVGRIGDLLEEHPIETMWIGDAYLAVAHELSPDDPGDADSAPKWVAYVGYPVGHPDRVCGAAWAWRAWDHRSDFVRDVGAWAVGVLS